MNVEDLVGVIGGYLRMDLFVFVEILVCLGRVVSFLFFYVFLLGNGFIQLDEEGYWFEGYRFRKGEGLDIENGGNLVNVED